MATVEINYMDYRTLTWLRAIKRRQTATSDYILPAIQQQSSLFDSKDILSACNLGTISGRVLGSWMEMSFAAKATAGLNVEVDD